MWIGVDDTDGPDGGCTTYVLSEIVAAARDLHLDLLGYPKLVRLDPNVPWKTRGNGALAARFGHGTGPARVVGAIDQRTVHAFDRGRSLRATEEEQLFEAARAAVRSGSSNAPGADPALVAAPRRPSPVVYRRAVAEVVPGKLAREALRAVGGRAWFRGGRRGIVGATAAIAWPARHRTFELLAYRGRDRLGTRRTVDPTSVRAAVARHPELFLCFDPRTRRLLIAPHTRCPILFGLRATTAEGLPDLLGEIRSEPVDRWLVFETNQATGDHLVPRDRGRWPAFSAGTITGVVGAPPETIRGGHVRLLLTTRGDRIVECWAFEPSKTLAPVARSLQPGDRIRVDGGRGRSRPVRVERITILSLGVRRGIPVRPRCDRCRRSTESRGSGRGFRCPGCRTRFPPESAKAPVLAPRFPRGTYDPTPSARRHLHPRAPEP
jgi:tRNA(Ile2)-agmatinylcytidine synthase